MATDYISLLNLTYEIEGLLMLHINRGEEAAPEMTRLLQSKISRLAEAMTENQDSQPLSQDSQENQIDDPDQPTADTPAVPAAETDTDEYNDDFNETEPTPDQQSIATSTIMEETEDAEPETVNPAPSPISVAPASSAPADNSDEPIRLEDKLARDRARDIFKAFTINDKFRFRRELFRNSQEEFDETLYVIAQMSNFDEAEEYFYNDLCWNPDSEDVKEFMDIVKKHF